MIVGGLVGLGGSILTARQNNLAEAAASAEATSEAEETRRRLEFERAQRQRMRQEAEAQRVAADQEAGFQIGQATEQGRQAVGSARASVGASGISGGSKLTLVNQIASDIDTVIGQMGTRRDEANRAALEAISIQRGADEEVFRQMGRGADLLDAEAASLAEASEFGWNDIANITIGTFSGALGGISSMGGPQGSTPRGEGPSLIDPSQTIPGDGYMRTPLRPTPGVGYTY